MHSQKLFLKTTQEYKKQLKGLKGTALIKGSFLDKKAFFSIAPLSKALHDSGIDVFVSINTSKKNNLDLLERIWNANESSGKENSFLNQFTEYAEKNHAKGFSKIFKKPEIIIECTSKGFSLNQKILKYNADWFRKFNYNAMQSTCKNVLKNCYALKKSERFSVSFELVPGKEMLDLPLSDYLDNFAIAFCMASEAKKQCKSISLNSSTSKKSRLAFPERISELSATIAACEYEKKIKEKPFQLFSKLSQSLKLSEWQYSDASFLISGKGYKGKHLFGLAIGYPDPNKKTRWSYPGKMFLKPWWASQTKIDKRKPITRLGLTETIPLEEFIQTCNLNYSELRKRSALIASVLEKSDFLEVKADVKSKGSRHLTELKVWLGKGKKKRVVQSSESDVRQKIDLKILKKVGVYSGTFANFPSGEVFFTPENIEGIAVGDVVVSIDQSYVLKKPFSVKFKKGKWQLLEAPAHLKKTIKKELADTKKLIDSFEENKSLPKKITQSYKKNIRRTGEFAINTNPKAKLSRYLIVNEKLANMIHIALGSGFEPDRQTLYHWDFVINAIKQKMTIKAVKGKKESFIIKKGKFVI